MKKNIFLFTIKVVTWLSLIRSRSDQPLPLSSLVKLLEKLDLILRSRGLIYTIKYVKALRGNFLNYLSGNVVRDPISKCTKDGLPIILGDLMPHVRRGDNQVIAFLLTILYATRTLKFQKEVDTSSITQPWKGDVTNLLMWSSSFWKELGYSPATNTPRSLRANTKYFSLKRGPNGHALTTSTIDANSLPETLITSLRWVGGDKIWLTIRALRVKVIGEFFMKYLKVDNIGPGKFRRISSFPDKEGKMRTIGILDYYSQISLKPLHIYLSNVLKRIPQDCTFDQKKFKDLIHNKEIYYSVDLSNATDRFPIFLIENLLKAQLPDKYVDAWKDIMVGYPFDYNGTTLSYSTGNPMGAYSSFNSFALTHHYIIYTICKKLGKKWKSLPYALLGDDIVIADQEVGEEYMKVIKTLGLDISMMKTHKSKDLYEFAKRIYYKGQEITPFPVSALKECGKSFGMLTTLLVETRDKGWLFPDIPSSIGMYFGVVKNLPSRFKKKQEANSWLFEGVLLTVQGKIPVNKFLNELIKKNNYPLPELSEEVCKNIISNCAVEAFSSSNIVDYFNFKYSDVPLIKMASDIQLEYIKLMRGLPYYIPVPRDVFNSWSSNDSPIVQAAFAVSELYANLEKEITNVDKTGGDWTYYMRNFALPKNDKTFYERQDFALTRSINSFVTLMDQRLQVLVEYPQLLNF
ncbi:RNA-dependent RNA polymerase [Loramyces juncicola mitovirus 1]|nr:RNA-dependent RNA polymerase [Loramyces juncicola mitovirus 1]